MAKLNFSKITLKNAIQNNDIKEDIIINENIIGKEDIRLKYNIVNPVVDQYKPYYNKIKNLFYFPVNRDYKYYIEATQIDENTHQIKYYLLLSINSFNDNCRRCEVTSTGKCKVQVYGRFKDYIVRECKERGNIICDLVESTDDYDIFVVI